MQLSDYGMIAASAALVIFIGYINWHYYCVLTPEERAREPTEDDELDRMLW